MFSTSYLNFSYLPLCFFSIISLTTIFFYRSPELHVYVCVLCTDIYSLLDSLYVICWKIAQSFYHFCCTDPFHTCTFLCVYPPQINAIIKKTHIEKCSKFCARLIFFVSLGLLVICVQIITWQSLVCCCCCFKFFS